MSIKSLCLSISDMACTSCERKIEKELKILPGIKSAKASYKKGEVKIEFDSDILNYSKIISSINKCGYTVIKDPKSNKNSELIPILFTIAIGIFIVILSNNSGSFNISESLSSKVSYGILFVIGIFSSLHCIGMCGGIMLSQSISIDTGSKFKKLRPSLIYNSGRLISYTILGGIVGGLGSVLSLSTSVQSFISVFAGIFMVIMGLNIYGFKALRKFSFKLPWSNCNISKNKKTPFIVGLINGFMPCGPLQAMQLYALATGSVLSGALSMFFFALGTIPLMMIFGLISSLMTTKGTKTLLKFSGLIVLILGISMTNRGLALMGIDFTSMINIPSKNSQQTNVQSDNVAVINGDEQTVKITAKASGYSPKTIYVQKGIKTTLIIDGETLTSCNNEVIFPSLNIRKKLSKGENVIEFTPGESDINFSCWMGMKRAKIKVVDDINSISSADSQDDVVSENREVEFYGTPLSKIPTSKLIKDAELSENIQKITITDEKRSLKPLVILSNSGLPLSVDFNIDDIPSIDGEYSLFDNTLTNIVSVVNIKDGKGTLSIDDLSPGAYGLIRNNRMFLIIEVSSDAQSIDKEYIRKKYF